MNDHTYPFEEVYQTLRRASQPSLDFYVLTVLSVVIATMGLLLDSAAVVIGAMVIAPLMDSILAISFSSLTHNTRFRLRSIGTLSSGILLGLLVSWLLASVFGGVGSTGEIASRTHPSMLDLVVALASGFMGGYAKVRKGVSGTVFGAAIAIALVPPLSVVGIGLAYGDSQIWGGSALLFLTNVLSIVLSGTLAFALLEFRQLRKSLGSLVVPAVSILVLSVPLMFSFWSLTQNKLIREVLVSELQHRIPKNERETSTLTIEDLTIHPWAKPVDVAMTVHSTHADFNMAEVAAVRHTLERRLRRPVDLTIHIAELATYHNSARLEGEPLHLPLDAPSQPNDEAEAAGNKPEDAKDDAAEPEKTPTIHR